MPAYTKTNKIKPFKTCTTCYKKNSRKLQYTNKEVESQQNHPECKKVASGQELKRSG